MAVASRHCHGRQTGSAAICQRHSLLRLHGLLRRRQAVCEPRACSSQGKAYDLLALSNLCIDVVVPVDDVSQLGDQQARRALLGDLHSRTFSEDSWELGGSMNTMIAAARLGLRVGAIGHMGDDAYGRWCARELEVEGIAPVVPILLPGAARPAALDRTLVCFVLVDPNGKHAFCSAYDFGPWPLLEGVTELPPAVKQALRSTHAVVANGFVFDDLPLQLVQDAARTASEAGAAICFDPGPRCFTMRSGSRRQALDALLDLSDIVLMTLEEAQEVTGHTDAGAAAAAILARPGAKTQWCCVKQGAKGALLATRGPGGAHEAPAMQVEVSDTVGCGDSFAAAIALGYIRRHAIPPTLVLANAVGAATAMGRGAGRNVADAATVQELLQGARAAGSHAGTDVSAAMAILTSSLSSGDGVGSGSVGPSTGNGSLAGSSGGNGGAGTRQGASTAQQR